MTDILPFKVTFPDRLLLDEWGDLSRVYSEDLDDLVYAELLFEEQYHNPENIWTIHVGDSILYFDIADIWFIWEELPDLLTGSMSPTSHAIEFSFVSQGTDTILYVTYRDEDTIFLSIIKMYSGQADLQPVLVDKRNFVQEWIAFAEKVMRILVTQDFIAANNPAVADYFARMPSL